MQSVNYNSLITGFRKTSDDRKIGFTRTYRKIHKWACNNILLDTVKSLLDKINLGQFSIIQSNGIN